MGPTHRAEVGELRPLGGQGFVEELGVERAIALVVTVELEVRLTEPVSIRAAS